MWTLPPKIKSSADVSAVGLSKASSKKRAALVIWFCKKEKTGRVYSVFMVVLRDFYVGFGNYESYRDTVSKYYG